MDPFACCAPVTGCSATASRLSARPREDSSPASAHVGGLPNLRLSTRRPEWFDRWSPTPKGTHTIACVAVCSAPLSSLRHVGFLNPPRPLRPSAALACRTGSLTPLDDSSSRPPRRGSAGSHHRRSSANIATKAATSTPNRRRRSLRALRTIRRQHIARVRHDNHASSSTFPRVGTGLLRVSRCWDAGRTSLPPWKGGAHLLPSATPRATRQSASPPGSSSQRAPASLTPPDGKPSDGRSVRAPQDEHQVHHTSSSHLP
jgi:hypothetical protein